MDESKGVPLSHKRKASGSGNRQKQYLIGFRGTAEDRTALKAGADAAGLTLSSHIRQTMLASSTVRSRRRPLADVAALSATYAQLCKVGGNINQIAKSLNSWQSVPESEITGAMAALRTVLADIRSAIGSAR